MTDDRKQAAKSTEVSSSVKNTLFCPPSNFDAIKGTGNCSPDCWNFEHFWTFAVGRNVRTTISDGSNKIVERAIAA